MNTFRNKQFKNELDPKYAFYDCLRSCEIKSNSESSFEETNSALTSPLFLEQVSTKSSSIFSI